MDRAQAGRDVDPGGPAIPGPDDPLDSGIHTWGMCTDAVQPISNGLYARRGMVPADPDLAAVRRGPALVGAARALPDALEAVAVRGRRAGEPDGPAAPRRRSSTSSTGS